MTRLCPWCGNALPTKFVRDLTNISQSAPCCNKPIAQSLGQRLFSMAALLPFVMLTLYLAHSVYEKGYPGWAVTVFIAALGLGIYLYQFIPVLHGPGRSFDSGSSEASHEDR